MDDRRNPYPGVLMVCEVCMDTRADALSHCAACACMC